MKDERKTKAQLVQELAALRQRLAKSETKHPHGKSSSDLASFPEMNPNPVVEVDFAGTVHYLNPAAEELFPDLQTLGIRHPWLANWDSMSAVFKKAGRVSHKREICIDDVWYEQLMYLAMESDRIRIYGLNVTQRKKIEQELRQTYELLEAVTSGTEVIIAAQDKDFRYTFFNKAYQKEIQRLTGKDIQVGSSMVEVFAHMPEQQKVALEEWSQVLRGENTNKIIEFGDPNRYGRVYNVLHAPIRDAEGTVVAAGEVAYDVTEKVRSQDALRKSKERFEILSETAAKLLGTERPQEMVNELCRKVMNHLDCHTCFNYLVNEERQCLQLNAYAGIPEETAREIEWLQYGVAVCGCAARDGARIIAENIPETLDPRTDLVRSFGIKAYACHPLFADGQVIGTLSFGTRTRTSFTEEELSLMKTVADQVAIAMQRMRLVEELRESRDVLDLRVQERTAELAKANELLERVFSGIDLSLAYMDKDFNFIRVNRAYAEADEKTPEFYTGKNHFALFPHEGNEAIFKKVVETGEPYFTYGRPFTYVDHPERGVTYWDWSLQPIKDTDGRVGGVILSLVNVTDRQQAKEAVKAEQQRFHDVLEVLPVYVVLLAPDYRVPFANRFFRERFGESHGHRCYEFLFGRSEPCEICETYSALKSMAPHRWEWTGPDGRNYDVFDFPFTDKDGSTLILEMGIDITERNRAVESLKASSIYARRLIEASLDPLVTISAEGKIMDVNKATELATGVARQDLIGSDFSDYFTEPGKAREGYEQVFLEGSIRDYPLTIQHTSGRITEVLYSATVYKNEAGEVQGVFAAARDITRRKMAEQERLRLVTAIEQTSEGILILDIDLNILYANLAFEKLHDLSRQEILGRKYDAILSDEIREKRFQNTMPDTLSRGEVWNGRFTQRKPGGGSIELEVTISPVRDVSGISIHYVAMERDVTLEKKLQEHVRQWQKMEALGTLAGGIAHDFNNILMPIVINSELALLDVQEGKSPSPQYLQLVREAANRGQELVRQIITFSRQKEQLRRAVEITPVIKEGLKFIRATIPKSIEIKEQVMAQPALVVADPTQIHQVLMNLCSNAAHAMREKGGVLEVSLTQVDVDAEMAAQHLELNPGPYIRLTVSDTGHGMDREVRERAFDPFFTTKKPGEGTGMGLSVVHGIVKNHDGVILLYSEVGMGTTVHVFLPRIQGEVQSKVASLGPIPTGKERILLVDDEEIQVRSLQNMLERLGYRVIGKTDPREVLEIFKAQPDAFDLLITDQTMPHLTGGKLAQELLGIRPDLPIILCTGFSEVIHEEDAKALGIREFAMKPLTVRDMADRIRRALGKK